MARAANALADRQQELCVEQRVVIARDDARIAIELDGKSKTSQLPPQRDVPRHGHDGANAGEREKRIARARVLELVRDDQFLLGLIEDERPRRYDDVMTEEADDRRTKVLRHERDASTDCSGTAASQRQRGSPMCDEKREGEQEGCQAPEHEHDDVEAG